MAEKRRSYTPEFKANVIAQVQAGKSPTEIAREAKIHPSLVYYWTHRGVKANGKPAKPNGHALSSRSELTQLQRELRATLFTQRRLVERIAKLTAAGIVERMKADLAREVESK